MILELLFGLIASVAIMLFFRVARYSESANTWIISMSKFVYFSGHPLLNDDQKFEQVTQIYRSIILSLLRVILKTFLIILFALGTIAVVATLCGFIRESALPDPHSPYFLRLLFPDYLLDWPFIVGTLLPFVLVPLLSKKDYKEEYSSMDKFVHYLFLGNKLMAKLQFRLECLLNMKTIRTTKPFQHIYISGLARSGSTSLMQYLGKLPEFVSLSYLNMPFIFMPRTGPKLISKVKKKRKKNERTRTE